MKKLSDYQGEQAIELWGELIEPVSTILADPDIVKMARAGNLPMVKIVQQVIKKYAREANIILTAIDDTPVDGVNVISRLLSLVTDLKNKGFFGSAESGETHPISTGSAMENTRDGEN